ncbi:hypothetical protein Bca4012_015913 [Brassica carinata]|uniref:DUF4378 domain-containing protein n=1 Tax=Brassica carinata TaxID=52824 RepID=A0A8X8BDC0_BRACI|nr:hypothetical protein Bca52824_005809 [Brassica carinata]
MASQRHLKDLLEEDQEPFQLQSYISDRRRQITHLQVKKRRPVSQNAGLPSRFCRNACFFSLRESPDPKKSPLFEPKSPIRSQNAIFVNIPARTASMLLEAAVRIQKQSTEGSRKKTRNVGNAFGIFGSMLKKLTHRKKREISGGKDGGGVSSGKDMLRWETPVVRKIVTKRNGEEQSSSQTQKTASETQFSRRSSSSGVWSESVTNGERSWDCDFEPSISSSSGSDGLDGLACGLTNGSDLSDDTRFCESPFRFVLQTTLPSPGGFRTPNFTSPAASPRHHCPEMKKESYEVEKLKKLEIEEEEEEDKEQSSPVSVLDPPFEDDDEDIHMDDKNITSSFRSVQKAKNLLLQKLCRFEQLAGLDPLEFEKSMSDQETEEDMEEEEGMRNHYQCEMITQRVLKTYFEDMTEVPEGIEALISDLVTKELQNNSLLHDGEAQVTKRVCERLRSWRDVESNTIDMMVEHDFRTESLGSWRSKNDAEVSEAVVEIEFEIFENLVEELSQDIGGYW